MNERHRATRRGLWVMCAAAVGAAWLVFPDEVSAGHASIRLGQHRSSVWVPPVYETQRRVVTFPAVCEERPRRIWHEPVYDVRKVLVDVPAKVVRERVATRGRYGRIIGYRVVSRVIEPARQVWRTKRVLVRAGYYETVYERVCTQAVRTKVVYEKVLVRPGHWVRPKVARIHHGPRRHRLGGLARLHAPRDDRWSVAFDVGW